MATGSSRPKIKDQYQLDFQYSAGSWSRRKRLANWFGFGVAVLLCAIWLMPGNSQVFQSRPVSAAHANLAHDCRECHQTPWQPALRLVALSSDYHSVPDSACIDCHKSSGEDHHAGRIVVDAAACAECHREHRPDGRELTSVDSRHCTTCHGDLRIAAGMVANFSGSVSGFDDRAHPEFAIKRKAEAEIGPEHGVHDVATFKGGWLDRGGVVFSHAHHLGEVDLRRIDGTIEKLDCAACHQLADDGRRMSPIRYEAHCAQCHPLLLEGEGLEFLGEVPHGEPEMVRGTIRGRIHRNLATPASSIDEADDGTGPEFPGLLPFPQLAELTPQGKRDLRSLVTRADKMFSLQAKGHCRKCHQLKLENDQWSVLVSNPEVVANPAAVGNDGATIMPDRWMKHARFDHGRHTTMSCTECHLANESTVSADILLPSKTTCFKCHGPDATEVSVPARADCIACHRYHDESFELPARPATELVSPQLGVLTQPRGNNEATEGR